MYASGIIVSLWTAPFFNRLGHTPTWAHRTEWVLCAHFGIQALDSPTLFGLMKRWWVFFPLFHCAKFLAEGNSGALGNVLLNLESTIEQCCREKKMLWYILRGNKYMYFIWICYNRGTACYFGSGSRHTVHSDDIPAADSNLACW